MAYLMNVLLAFDRFINAIFLGNPNETISARMGREIQAGRCHLCKPVCWLLDKVDPNHCIKATQPDD